MSEAVKAAIAARRAAALRSNSNNATSLVDDDDLNISTLGSPRVRNVPRQSAELAQHAEAALAIAQKPLEELLLKSCTTGRLILSSRAPPLDSTPSAVFTLLADEAPSWYSAQAPWYERQDLTTLVLSTNEITEVPDRLSDFAMLAKLELHSNRISQLPPTFNRFSHLSHLTLSRNALTSVPTCILALDTLVTLDLSHNRLERLWTDASVLSSRDEREKFVSENENEEGGVWAGLIARSGSPTKKAPPKAEERSQPLRGLRTLNLSDNKLANTALGLPAVGIRKAGSILAEPATLHLPPLLVSLDLGNNALRDPLPLDAFAALDELKVLSLAGNGIADEVFTSSDASASLAALQTLDLQRCEIDDLTKLEAFFGSGRTHRFDGEEQAAGKVEGNLASGPGSLTKRQLVRVAARQADVQLDAAKGGTSEGGLPLLSVVIEGNPLREEAFRRKRGLNSPIKSTFTKIFPAANPSLPSRPLSTFTANQVDTTTTVASSSTTTTPEPTKAAQPAKEEWESAYMSEGQKRRMRAEQARREREEASGDGGVSGAGTAANDASARGRNGTRRGVNTTGLSDWDGEPAPLKPGMRGNKDRGTSATRSGKDDDEGNGGMTSDEAGEGADGAAGSALANAKLSTKKKEALSQVPCKFYRSNGCSAGAACPFAHVLPGEGAQKATCQWFLKGSCRFGHKCALAHVLPGESIAMDRKNKRAAQQSKSRNGDQGSQPGRVQGQSAGQGQGQAQAQRLAQAQGQGQGLGQGQGQGQGAELGYGARGQNGHHNRVPGTEWDDMRASPAGGLAAAMRARQQGSLGSQHRDQDFPFGLPDDMLPPPPQGGSRGQLYPSIGASQLVNADHDVFGKPGNRDLTSQPATYADGLPASTTQRPLSVPRNTERTRMSMDASQLVGSPTSRAFGTSPFSQPGGPSLFFSGSQDSEGGAGRFARPSLPPSAHSMGQLDDVQARARWFGVKGRPTIEDTDDFNEEDFLPSSLSDLLTPAELERRRRNSNAAPISRATTQSMPAEAGANAGSLWDLNFRNTGPGQDDNGLSTSNTSLGFMRTTSGRYASRSSQGIEGHSGQSTQAINRAGAFGAVGITNGAAAYSPRAQAALHHAPGQSLPQGLAAGLSRLHLQSARADARAASSNSPGPGTRVDASASIRASLNTPTSPLLHIDELGPTAPASILAHRPSPLSLAAARSQGKSYGGHFGGVHSSPSASSPHFGTSPYSASSGHGFAGMTHLTSKRPDMDRVRSGAPPHGSPLAVPTMEEDEIEDEPMFELE